MKRMFEDIEKAKKLGNREENSKFEEKRATTGRQMKSNPILDHLPNSFFDLRQAISK